MPGGRRRLYRSESDRMIAGVLGGLAEYPST
ncbi:MAG TPA: PspC domain-containing protein [Dehalococcoidia bacterium]|nr:PspC domain-containing protein [Dehalococcoidia bacterium]